MIAGRFLPLVTNFGIPEPLHGFHRASRALNIVKRDIIPIQSV